MPPKRSLSPPPFSPAHLPLFPGRTPCYRPAIAMKALQFVVPLALTLPFAVLAAETKIDVSKLPLPVPRKVDFVKEVYPIFKESCISCHGPEKQKGKYRMDSREAALKETDYGPAILPGKSEQSAIIHMACNLIDEMMMPPPSDKPGQSEPLTKEQIGILRAWIDQGAEWVEGSDPWLGSTWEATNREKAEVTRHFDLVADWARRHHNVRILLGEFGAYSRANMDSRVRWTEYVRSEAERHGFAAFTQCEPALHSEL